MSSDPPTTVEVFFRSKSARSWDQFYLDDWSFYDHNGNKLPVESVSVATNPLSGISNHRWFSGFTQDEYRLENLVDSNPDSYWVTDHFSGSLIFQFPIGSLTPATYKWTVSYGHSLWNEAKIPTAWTVYFKGTERSEQINDTWNTVSDQQVMGPFTVPGPLVVNDSNLSTYLAQWVSDAQATEAAYGHINTWDTSGVTNMESLFQGNSSFNDDISGWDTSNVTTMSRMFYGCEYFNQDISGWETHNVTNMEEMFLNAAAFDQDIGIWTTQKVTTYTNMFSGATAMLSRLSDSPMTPIATTVRPNTLSQAYSNMSVMPEYSYLPKNENGVPVYGGVEYPTYASWYTSWAQSITGIYNNVTAWRDGSNNAIMGEYYNRVDNAFDSVNMNHHNPGTWKWADLKHGYNNNVLVRNLAFTSDGGREETVNRVHIAMSPQGVYEAQADIEKFNLYYSNQSGTWSPRSVSFARGRQWTQISSNGTDADGNPIDYFECSPWYGGKRSPTDVLDWAKDADNKVQCSQPTIGNTGARIRPDIKEVTFAPVTGKYFRIEVIECRNNRKLSNISLFRVLKFMPDPTPTVSDFNKMNNTTIQKAATATTSRAPAPRLALTGLRHSLRASTSCVKAVGLDQDLTTRPSSLFLTAFFDIHRMVLNMRQILVKLKSYWRVWASMTTATRRRRQG